MKKLILIAEFLLICILITGCQRPTKFEEIEIPVDYDKPLPPGESALRLITNPHDIPDFTFACYNLGDLKEATAKSINYLKKPSSKQFYPRGPVSHDMAVESLEAFAKLLNSRLRGKNLSAAITEKFDVYTSVGCDNRGTVLFTGYYTPIFDGSMTETEKFKYPLYKQPPDLIKGDKGKILGQKSANGRMRPYPTRAQLQNSNALDGLELIWMACPFEVYITHVQGSAKIRLLDGELVGLGYAASNGREYKSLSKKMLAQGKFDDGKMSLSAMIDYFKVRPDRVNTYIAMNPRFVFFRTQSGDPRGSINEEVTAYRSIATDKTIFPPGGLTFISTRIPYEKNGGIIDRPYTAFALDQDTGGAIRAAGRCDIYMGQGDKAGTLAGRTYQEGRLYYLLLK
ncbi:MAG: MltA domain-containing protein [Anaerohalosphaeraceae bacterium]|nr:MltA domain-containing protein [Anaerohalosphaeraceae bacterium]